MIPLGGRSINKILELYASYYLQPKPAAAGAASNEVVSALRSESHLKGRDAEQPSTLQSMQQHSTAADSVVPSNKNIIMSLQGTEFNTMDA